MKMKEEVFYGNLMVLMLFLWLKEFVIQAFHEVIHLVNQGRKRIGWALYRTHIGDFWCIEKDGA